MSLENLTVAIAEAAAYPEAPFHPSAEYPEFLPGKTPVQAVNAVYSAVRQCFRLLKLDELRFGSTQWNPLGDLIKPGDRVLLKPNCVLHFNAGGGPLEAVTTHGSVIRAIADYVLLALGNRGSLTIGDAPQMNCDFEVLSKKMGLDVVSEYLAGKCRESGIEFRIRDFRRERTIYKYGIVWKRIPLGEQRSVDVNLRELSFMGEIDSSLLYGADYARGVTARAHSGSNHLYKVHSDVLESDVVISIPKLKVHSKVGTTLNIKNMVGINTDKNHLAHYRVGPPSRGGDEIANANFWERTDRWLSDELLGKHWAVGKYPFVGWRAVRAAASKVGLKTRMQRTGFGNWAGNDTAWRMALDLNTVLFFARRDGSLSSTPVRKYLSVIDGIVAGQGNGPLHPAPFNAGVVLSGMHPLAVDWVGTCLMGFDPAKIKMYSHGEDQAQKWFDDFSVKNIKVESTSDRFREVLFSASPFQFEPPPGWINSIESHRPGENGNQSAQPMSRNQSDASDSASLPGNF
jgi:uncharacterized protein (DUF362 family)